MTSTTTGTAAETPTSRHADRAKARPAAAGKAGDAGTGAAPDASPTDTADAAGTPAATGEAAAGAKAPRRKGAPGKDKGTPPRTSRREQLVRLLTAKGGASLDRLCAETGWQPHSVRAAISGLRKAGYAVERTPANENKEKAAANAAGKGGGKGPIKGVGPVYRITGRPGGA